MKEKKAKKKTTAKKKTATSKPKAKAAPKPKPLPVLHTCANCRWWNNFGTDELGTCSNNMSHYHTVNRKSGKSCEMWEKKVV